MKPITILPKAQETKNLERLTIIAAATSLLSAIYLLVSQVSF